MNQPGQHQAAPPGEARESTKERGGTGVGLLLARNPELARARSGGPALLRRRRLLGARRRVLAGRGPAAAAALGERHLELAEGVADLRGVRPEHVLDDRQQRAGALDRQPQLVGVGLVLGTLRQAGAAAAEVDE